MAAAALEAGAFEDVYFRVRDGVRLHARRYPSAAKTPARPVLCLAGLTRNARDFHDLATALAAGPADPREVWALDARGRGLSSPDPDWKGYTVPNEAQDVVDMMAAFALHGAAIVGTSRGGLVAMVLAAIQPTAVGPVVLNDIGPVIERDGLIRIAGYVGKVGAPQTWAEAAQMVAAIGRSQFPRMSEAEWQTVARQLFNERDGRPVAGYDAKLARSLSAMDGPPPALWPQFGALGRVPVMVVRGALSDLLSAATVKEMVHRHPRAEAFTVPDQGHAPWLRDRPTIEAIQRFLVAAK
jgi:pimeloyl-ACP methyl ester carboxylesterase